MAGTEAEKHVIWSDLNLDYEDWREFLEEEYPGRTEEEYRMLMYELNADYLDDERSNLNIQLSMPILVCADLGLWNGRKTGYKMIDSGNIRDCLSDGCDYNEWFVDQKGDLRCTAVHHDGANHYLYRAVKEGIPDWRIERLQDKLYSGKATETDIARVTRRLGDEIAAVYGYDIPESDEKERFEMEKIDVGEELFDEIELIGRTGLFTELLVDKHTIPDGVYCYELRHGDDDSFPTELEENVSVNYFGAVLMTEKLELDKDGKLPIGYEDFRYTGEQMFLPQLMEKNAVMCEIVGEEIMKFLNANGNSFEMSEEEAVLLNGYINGHGYIVGHKEGKLYRGDLCKEYNSITWEETTIDDLVDSASEWNYELIQKAKADMENSADFADFESKQSRYEKLCTDEKVLDAMFNRTRYGKELEALAVTMAETLIQDMKREGGIDAAIEKMAAQIREGVDLLPDVSPALKQNMERSR